MINSSFKEEVCMPTNIEIAKLAMALETFIKEKVATVDQQEVMAISLKIIPKDIFSKSAEEQMKQIQETATIAMAAHTLEVYRLRNKCLDLIEKLNNTNEPTEQNSLRTELIGNLRKLNKANPNLKERLTFSKFLEECLKNPELLDQALKKERPEIGAKEEAREEKTAEKTPTPEPSQEMSASELALTSLYDVSPLVPGFVSYVAQQYNAGNPEGFVSQAPANKNKLESDSEDAKTKRKESESAEEAVEEDEEPDVAAHYKSPTPFDIKGGPGGHG
jgi:hypothetical protein